MKRIETIAIYALFLLIIIFPFTYYEFKIPILAWFVGKSFLKSFLKLKLDISLTVFGLFIIYIGSGLFFILYGKILGTAHPESFFYVFLLYVGFPVLYFILITGINKYQKTIEIAERTLFIGVFGVSIVLFLAFLNKKYGLPPFFDFLIDKINVDIRTTADVVKINYHGISSILFIFPFLLTRYLLKKGKTRKEITWNIIALIVGFVGVFLTGRRALIILFFLSIGLAILFKIIWIGRIKIKRKALNYAGIVFIVSLPLLFTINIGSLLTSVSSTVMYALNLNSKKSAEDKSNERLKQIQSFGNYIYKKPVLGYGHGAVMKEVIRSKDKPWRYEISYLDIIFHTGFIGFFLYASGPIWIFLSLIRIAVREPKYRPSALGLLNGLICVFIAYATNPYLNALDIQWVIYYPILFIMIVNKISLRNAV